MLAPGGPRGRILPVPQPTLIAESRPGVGNPNPNPQGLTHGVQDFPAPGGPRGLPAGPWLPGPAFTYPPVGSARGYMEAMSDPDTEISTPYQLSMSPRTVSFCKALPVSTRLSQNIQWVSSISTLHTGQCHESAYRSGHFPALTHVSCDRRRRRSSPKDGRTALSRL